MRFHGVLLGNQHEMWSKQHNGKVRISLLPPFGRGLSFSTERNRYGTVSFDAKEMPQSSADCISQVFKNGELWGISKWALGGTRRQDVIPSMSIEEDFESIMMNYLQFAQDKLQLALPIKFIAGLLSFDT